MRPFFLIVVLAIAGCGGLMAVEPTGEGLSDAERARLCAQVPPPGVKCCGCSAGATCGDCCAPKSCGCRPPVARR